MKTPQLPLTALAWLLTGLQALAAVEPAKPNVVQFDAYPAKFVRLVIHESSSGQPCLDELEVFDMQWSLPHHKAEPLTFGTVKSRLSQVLAPGHQGVTLTRDEMHRVKCWIDLNCPLWPDYTQRELRSAMPKTAAAHP